MKTSEQFHKYEDEFLKFERIPLAKRLHLRPDICAMLYISNLFPEAIGIDIIIFAEHEIFGVPIPDKLTDEDVIYLSRCGVHYSTEFECLAFFT